MDRKDQLNLFYEEYKKKVITHAEKENIEAFKTELNDLSEIEKKVARINSADSESEALVATYLDRSRKVFCSK
jgi:hypothetical protein